MECSHNYHHEIKTYENTPFELLSLQDALILITVCAANIDGECCRNDVKRITDLAQSHPLFQEKPKVTTKRVNWFSNQMINKGFGNAVDIAVKTLTPELMETVFGWAAEIIISKNGLTEGKKSFLEKLLMKLSLDQNTAERIIAGKIGGSDEVSTQEVL